MIEVRSLSCHKRGKMILDHISYTFKEGQTYGVIGPNGAGKSTLLKHMMGLMTPSKGEVYYGGENIRNIKIRDYANKVSFVFQENTRSVDFTVYEMLLMGKYTQMDRWGNLSKEEEEKVDKVLGELQITHLKEQPIHTLSGGEAQKVFIGRALLQETKVLLLDEPTSMLDMHNSIEMMHCIKRLQEKHGLTVIMVLHDLNLALQSCDTLLLMEQGQIVQVGSREELLWGSKLQQVYHHKLHVVQEEDKAYIVPKL